MDTRIACLTCGDLFEPRRSGGKPQVRCSARCRDLAAAKASRARNAPVKVAACAECGGPVAHQEKGRPRRFCSDECKRRVSNRSARRRRLPIRNPDPDLRSCLHCQTTFTSRRRDQVYCSPNCVHNASHMRRYNGAALRQGVVFKKQCIECGGAFDAKKINARWCSSRCRRRFTGREESRRRGPVRPGATPYTDLEIFERDGWVCHLCKGPIDPKVDRRSRLGATIDHLVPLSEGGADDPANVAAAHNSCNKAKGTRAMNEQLRLI